MADWHHAQLVDGAEAHSHQSRFAFHIVREVESQSGIGSNGIALSSILLPTLVLNADQILFAHVGGQVRPHVPHNLPLLLPLVEDV